MPGLPNPEYKTYPKVEQLKVGETLNIVSIDTDIEKTKNGYELMHLVDKDRGEMITLATGVRNKLKAALEAKENGDYDFSEKDPIVCTVSEYESHGRTCKSIS